MPHGAYLGNSSVGLCAQIPGNPVNPADAAAKLRALAKRVRHNVPRSGDPERFHIELSEIARGIGVLADEIGQATYDDTRESPVTAGQGRKPTAGRVHTTMSTVVVAGRRVAVQRRRMPFAIFVGN